MLQGVVLENIMNYHKIELWIYHILCIIKNNFELNVFDQFWFWIFSNSSNLQIVENESENPCSHKVWS